MKEKTLFTIYCIAIGVSFILCGYSLIDCFALTPNPDELGSHYLEIAYLFMHLIVCGILFYLSFRALRLGSFFIKNNVFDFDGKLFKKKWITYIIFASLFFVIFVYSFVQVITMKLPLAVQLGEIIWHDIMNAAFLISISLLMFVLYRLVPFKRSNKHAE